MVSLQIFCVKGKNLYQGRVQRPNPPYRLELRTIFKYLSLFFTLVFTFHPVKYIYIKVYTRDALHYTIYTTVMNISEIIARQEIVNLRTIKKCAILLKEQNYLCLFLSLSISRSTSLPNSLRIYLRILNIFPLSLSPDLSFYLSQSRYLSLK